MSKVKIVIVVLGFLVLALFVLEQRIDANHIDGLDPEPAITLNATVMAPVVEPEVETSAVTPARNVLPMQHQDWVVFSRTGTVHSLELVEGKASLKGEFEELTKTSACIKEKFEVDGPVEVSGRWKNTLRTQDKFANVSARFFGPEGTMTSGQGSERPVRLIVSAEDTRSFKTFTRVLSPPQDAVHVQICIELKARFGTVSVDGVSVGKQSIQRAVASVDEVNSEPNGGQIPPGENLVVVAPSGTEGRIVNKRNKARKDDELVIYTSEHGPVSRQSEYGAEIAIKNGLVSAVRPYGSTMELPIPGSGYILSGSGTAATYLKRFSVGDRVRLKPTDECLEPEDAVPVLVYHQLEHEGDSREVENHFRQMNASGYSSISLGQLDRWIEGVGEDMPDKPIVLTFDDGKKQHYQKLPEWMEKYDLQAVLFLIVTHLDHPFERFLTWDDARELVSTGRFDLQCHSYDAHRKIDTSDGVEMGVYVEKGADSTVEEHGLWRRRDLASCRNRLYAETGKNSRYIAWPFGQYDNSLIGAAALAGFEGMLTVAEGINGPGTSTTAIRRITVSPDMKWKDVEHRIQQWRVCPLMQDELAEVAPFSAYDEATAG
ncbi:MAG: polysaccharide deacetylase family protein [Myxococcota bacterium]